MLSLYPAGVYFGQVMSFLIQRQHGGLLNRAWPILLTISRPKNTSPTRQTRQIRPKLHERMLKAIHDVYSREMEQSVFDVYCRDESFIDNLAHDLDDGAAWFNNSEFARFHDIDGEKVLSIFTADTRSQSLNINIGGDKLSELVSKSRGVLFCRAQEVSAVNAEQVIRLDGRLYTVSEARLIQDQVWRIVLEANNG